MDTELLNGYSLPEKEAYLGAIASIATADREASEDELAYLSALAEASGVDPQAVTAVAHDPSNEQVTTYLDALKNSELRFALIADLLAFAKSDGKLTPEEQSRINEMASYLYITPQQTTALAAFADKSTQLQPTQEETQDQGFLEKSGLAGMLKNAGIPTSGLLKGLLGLAAPFVIAKMLRNRSHTSGGGGLLGSLVGAGIGGGILGSLLGNGTSSSVRNPGGLGSIFGNLSGSRGYGGIGSILGRLFQNR